VPPLRFEASVRSLEPKNSRAAEAAASNYGKNADALGAGACDRAWHATAQELHDDWQRITAHWTELQQAGKIKGFSTPAALVPFSGLGWKKSGTPSNSDLPAVRADSGRNFEGRRLQH